MKGLDECAVFKLGLMLLLLQSGPLLAEKVSLSKEMPTEAELTPAELAFNRGTQFEEAGELAEAIKTYSLAVKLDPKMEIAWANRANANVAAKHSEAAISDAERATALNQKDGVAYKAKSDALVQLRRFAEALAVVDLALARSDRAKGDLYVQRGHINSLAGNNEAAIADTNTGLNIAPESAELLCNMTIFLAKKSDPAAEAYIRKAHALEPDNPKVIELWKILEANSPEK